MHTHDPSYKLLFSHREMVRDLLLGFIDEPWVADLDLVRLEKSRGPEPLHAALSALIDWLGAPEQASLRRAFTVWIKRVL